MIQRAGAYANQHLVFSKLGIRHIFEAKDLRPAELVEPDGFHLLFSRSFDSRGTPIAHLLRMTLSF